jgi:thiamine biosynthesis lipoprotein
MDLPIKTWVVVGFLFALGGCAHAPPLERHQYVQLLMGVQVRLVTHATDEPTAKAAAKAAFERVAELEDIMSDYRPDSELMRLCARAGQGPVPVSQELFEVLAYAQKVSQASDGAFDVTVGPYVNLWRTARKTQALPAGSALADAGLHVGWRKMKLDPRNQTVELTIPGMKLDLGAIAKGYAGDEAIRVLKANGIRSALFEAGGDIVVSNPPPHSRGWIIETSDRQKHTLANSAISTSGDTEQFVDIAGVRYSHVVDPRTGIGLTKHFMATVIAPRGITTDSLSTAATVLGPGRGDALIRSFRGARGTIRIARETTSSRSSTTSSANP